MTSAPDNGWTAFELAVVVVLGMLAVAAAGMFALGVVAGVIFGEGAPLVALGDLPEIASRLPSHLDDPRTAWPRSARSTLPGAIGFGLSAVLVLAILGASVLGGVVLARRLRGRSAGASWGRSRELRALRVTAAPPGRLVLGRFRGGLVAAEPRQSVIVVAPTQTGKTTGLAVPAILEWPGPVLATSIKTDLVADTLARRRALGETQIFDPTGVTGHEPAHWTPLTACSDWQGARETADRLCSVAKPGHGMADGDFWSSAAARYLAPLMFAAARKKLKMADVVFWIDSNQQDRPRQILAELSYDQASVDNRVGASAALATLQGIWEGDERLRSSLAATAGVALAAYGDPSITASAGESELTPEWLLAGANTAYLCATATGQERLRPLFVTLIDQIVGHVYELAARNGGPIDPPLLIVLDEAANIAPLPRVDQLAATGAGQGIQLVTVVQDLAQIEHRWGRKADTIVNNHRAKLFGPGISCEKTLGYLTRILGDEAIPQRSVTRGERGRKTTTDATTFRALAPADRLRQRDPDTAILVYGSLPPAEIDLRPWYRDRDLKRLAQA